MADEPKQTLTPDVLAILRCPLTRSSLHREGDELVAQVPEGAGLRYPIKDGIPVLLIEHAKMPEGIESLDAFKAKYEDSVAD